MESILRFYILNNKLKKMLRQGWKDVKISAERMESVAEHVYGCLILAICINDEFNLEMNMEYILKMLVFHELEEIVIGDVSAIDQEYYDKKKMGDEAVNRVVRGLAKGDEIENLIKEFNARETKEAKYAYYIDKLECDFQAKLYDLDGKFDIEEEKKDCMTWNGDRAKELIEGAKCASDIWLDADVILYKDETFLKILAAIKKLNKEDYLNYLNDILK